MSDSFSKIPNLQIKKYIYTWGGGGGGGGLGGGGGGGLELTNFSSKDPNLKKNKKRMFLDGGGARGSDFFL